MPHLHPHKPCIPLAVAAYAVLCVPTVQAQAPIQAPALALAGFTYNEATDPKANEELRNTMLEMLQKKADELREKLRYEQNPLVEHLLKQVDELRDKLQEQRKKAEEQQGASTAPR